MVGNINKVNIKMLAERLATDNNPKREKKRVKKT